MEETNQIVESAGIPKEWIQIEITETIGFIDAGSLKDIVERFTEVGYKIALDDFGAEYSNIYHDKRARLVVENVINMCKKLQIEWVENQVKKNRRILRKYDGLKYGWLKDAEIFLLLLVIVFLVFQFVIGFTMVKGESMEPTLKDGELVLYTRIHAEYQKGNVVSVRIPSGEYYVNSDWGRYG